MDTAGSKGHNHIDAKSERNGLPSDDAEGASAAEASRKRLLWMITNLHDPFVTRTEATALVDESTSCTRTALRRVRAATHAIEDEFESPCAVEQSLPKCNCCLMLT